MHDHEPPPELHLVPPDDGNPVGRTPPHNPDAEAAVLGAILLSPNVFHDVQTILEPEDFYRPNHETIYTAAIELYARGEPVDAITVTQHLYETGDLRRVGGAPYLHTLIGAVPTAANGPHYARIVAQHAARRRLVTAALRIDALAHADTATDIPGLQRAATEALTAATTGISTHQAVRALNVDEFLDVDDATDYDWVVPDLLERGDRLILTAGEGHGKSTLLRQFGVQVAAGIHPFTLQPMTPMRVLLVDLENSERQTRRKLAPLRIRAAAQLDADRLHVICKPDGLDLTNPTDEAWLSNLMAAHRPDLLITGPIYKLTGGDPNKELDTKPAALSLDRLRTLHGCSLLLEAHSRKADGMDPRKRPKEPYGWSGWLRWPEFGLHLDEDGTISHWRGMRDQDRTVPEALNRGGTWPWTPATGPGRADSDARWQSIRRAIWQAGRELTEREIADATGLGKTTVHRVVGAYAMQYQALLHQLQMADS